MAENIQFTQATFDRLKDEHQHLTTVWRIDIAKRIEAARELGDLKENGDYHAAKEEQGKMDARMRQIQALLDDAEIVEAADTSAVGAGAILTLRYEGDTDTERYLLGSIEERRDGLDVMSPKSPLGTALMGHKVGDVVQYQAPGGTLRVEIVDISA